MPLKMAKSDNLCNTCPSNIRGLCCHSKIINRIERKKYILIYDKPCEHLNKAGRCKIYKKRHQIMGNKCLTIEEAIKRPFTLPYGCLYTIK